jgi:hypothetical protein
MRGLDIVLSERIKELELEADRAMDRTILLRKQAKESAFKIKSLEEEVHLILHVVDITPHIKFK